MAEEIVNLEDEVEKWKANNKTLVRMVMKNELDPSRLESALRMYVSELDYDIHKNLENGEEDGLDHYHEEVDYFLRCWETAGEGN
ncbi:hypothetical protein [Streptomyces sp. WG5]|uniref:hypothetical protein n=1 Tax=Streptomyces sp. WG5 TaxID=3417648 RepID=UPI003CEF2932